MLRQIARQQAPGRHADAPDDQAHARHHAVIHRHAGQVKAHVAAHPVHRQVQEDADRHRDDADDARPDTTRSEEHTSELQSLMRISYAVFCLKKISEKLISIPRLILITKSTASANKFSYHHWTKHKSYLNKLM